MQIFGFVLFAVILAVARAGGGTTILEKVFQIPDANANGAWEIEELTRYVGNSLFEEVDTNEDKRITIEEFKETCVKLLDLIFKFNDHNGDGFITSIELISGDVPIEPFVDILAIYFKVLDVNQDGFLSSQDAFISGEEAFGMIDWRSNKDNIPLTDFIDVNKDGVIGIQEFNQKNEFFFLPKAPKELVKLYNITDKNKDDKFTLEEIQDVLRTSLGIMDEDNDGIVTPEELLHAFTQVGLTRTQAEEIRGKWQISRSSDMANKIIAIMDTDNDKQVTQDELTDILDYPYNSLKIMQLARVAQEMAESNKNDDVVYYTSPTYQSRFSTTTPSPTTTSTPLSGELALEAFGRFLDNPRFD